MGSKNVWSTFNITVSLIGLLAQLNQVSIQYFAFKTHSKVIVLPHFEIRVPSLSSCFRIVDILNLTQLKLDYDLDFHFPNKTRDYKVQKSLLDLLPMKFILDNTPPIDNVAHCDIRFPQKGYLERFYGLDCYKHINVTKYFHRESICYKYTLDLDTNILSAKQYALSDEAFGVIFLFRLQDELFNRTVVVSSYVHDDKSEPFYDSLYAQYINIGNYEAEIFTTFNTVTEKSLKSPYDTNCQDYPKEVGGHVQAKLKLIQNEVLEKLTKLTPGLMVQDEFARGHIAIDKVNVLTSKSLRTNSTLFKIYSDIYKKHMVRGRTACNLRCLISRISYGRLPYLQFRVTWPDGLGVDVRYVPGMTPIDFGIYISSCVGVWMGLSVFSTLDIIFKVFGNRGHDKDEVGTRRIKIEMVRMQKINDRRHRTLIQLFSRATKSHPF